MAEENAKQAGTDAKESPAAGEGAAAKPAGGGKMGMLVVVIVGFLVMAITPLVTYFAVKANMPPPVDHKKEEEKESSKLIIALKPVNVNILKTNGTRILRVEVHLVLSDKRLFEELSKQAPMLVDRVIQAAGRKTLEELDGSEGNQALKRDIMSEINAAVQDKMLGSVIDVYFNEFIVQ